MKNNKAQAAEAKETILATAGKITGGAEPGQGVQEGGGLPPVATTAPETGATKDRPHADAIPEIEIMAKVMAGLTREQAIEVIKNQREHYKSTKH